jgi:tellurite methyltransferase
LSTGQTGGYEEGYEGSSCLWGGEPGNLVRQLLEHTSVAGREVLDLGAGEGKNAYFLADRGAEVTAVELSAPAIENGQRRFGESASVKWVRSDVADFPLEPKAAEIIVCYGLLHCLDDISSEVRRFQGGTKPGGWHVICAFNDRFQDLSAHPGFRPTLLPHVAYLALYAGWEIVAASDLDLTETHPHNGITHTHSMTRILARLPTHA